MGNPPWERRARRGSDPASFCPAGAQVRCAGDAARPHPHAGGSAGTAPPGIRSYLGAWGVQEKQGGEEEELAFLRKSGTKGE